MLLTRRRWAIILIAKNPAQEWSSTKLPWIAKRAREIIKEFEGDEVIAQSQNHDAATTIDELLKNLLAIEVHATCYAANFETATDIANYSLVVHARLGKMQITLGIVYGEEQKYRQSVWESQSHERMLDAIHTRNMLHAPGGQIAANALHDKASKAHACALQAVDRLAEMGVEGDLRRAAELIDHAKRRGQHAERTWRRDPHQWTDVHSLLVHAIASRERGLRRDDRARRDRAQSRRHRQARLTSAQRETRGRAFADCSSTPFIAARRWSTESTG